MLQSKAVGVLRHNSALLYENVVGSTDGSSFRKNFLTIGTNAGTEVQNRAYFIIYADDDEWTNIPPGLITTSVSVGLREVFRVSSTLCMVKITEFHPKPGTQYYRMYNNSAWNDGGWKVVTPD